GVQRRLGDGAGTTRSDSATVGVAYEADLWRRLANAHDAARWEADASAEDLASTALSLSGTAATLYWRAAYLQDRLRLSDDSLAYAGRTLRLAQGKQAAGAATTLDVLEAEQSLASQQATHASLLQQQIENRNALAVLLDGDALDVAPPATLADYALPDVLPGLPAQLLANRPDLRAAELRVRGALATVDATRASFYPTLKLNASVGGGSTALRDLLQNPVAALAGAVALPVLQWDTHTLDLRVSQADFDLTVVSFRQALYAALGDVDNALAASTHYAQQAEALTRSMRAARQVDALYAVRYRNGAASLQDWLDAQEKRRSAEASWLENRYNQLANQATLYLALGGSVTQ
ncbi:MAG: TolC family protein, partial [Rhodocyclaceae bacterium]